VIESTDALIASTDECTRPAGNDWRKPLAGKIKYSTRLSAIMALEVRARLLGRGRVPDDGLRWARNRPAGIKVCRRLEESAGVRHRRNPPSELIRPVRERS